MVRISWTEFGNEVGRYQDVALSEPVVVTRDGRDRTVMISAEEYRRLKRRDREVLVIEDFTDADAEAVRRAEPSLEAAAYNHENRTLIFGIPSSDTRLGYSLRIFVA